MGQTAGCRRRFLLLCVQVDNTCRNFTCLNHFLHTGTGTVDENVLNRGSSQCRHCAKCAAELGQHPNFQVYSLFITVLALVTLSDTGCVVKSACCGDGNSPLLLVY